MLLSIPEDCWRFYLLKYLSTYDIVHSLSPLSKSFRQFIFHFHISIHLKCIIDHEYCKSDTQDAYTVNFLSETSISSSLSASASSYHLDKNIDSQKSETNSSVLSKIISPKWSNLKSISISSSFWSQYSLIPERYITLSELSNEFIRRHTSNPQTISDYSFSFQRYFGNAQVQLCHLCNLSLDKVNLDVELIQQYFAYLINLEELEIVKCQSLSNTVGCFPKKLKSLKIISCEWLHYLFDLPATLEQLFVSDCTSFLPLQSSPFVLKDTSEEVDINSDVWASFKLLQLERVHSLTIFDLEPYYSRLPALAILKISYCPNLLSICGLSSSLEKLKIENCSRLLQIDKADGVDEKSMNLHSLILTNLSSLSFIFKLENLGKLSNVHFENLESLPKSSLISLALSLKKLRIEQNHFIESDDLVSFFNRFSALKDLNLSNLPSLTKLPALPSSLNSLIIRYCPNLIQIGDIDNEFTFDATIKLEMIVLDYVSEFSHLRLAPTSMKKLYLSNCYKLSEISMLPDNLEILLLHKLSSLCKLSPLPRSLRNLTCIECPFIGSDNLVFDDVLQSNQAIKLQEILLEKLALLADINSILMNCPYIENLRILNCYKMITDINRLPKTLKDIEICYSQSTGSEIKFSEGFYHQVKLTWCKEIKSLPNLDMCNILDLNLTCCTEITSLNILPKSLKTLNLTKCKSLMNLPMLPEGLNYLNLSDCIQIHTFPLLPESLRVLDLSFCKQLEYIGNGEGIKLVESLPVKIGINCIPQQLKQLVVHQCSSLVYISNLPDTLVELDIEFCSQELIVSHWPKKLRILHFNFD